RVLTESAGLLRAGAALAACQGGGDSAGRLRLLFVPGWLLTATRTVFRDHRFQNSGNRLEDVAGRAVAANLMILAVLIIGQHGPRHLIIGANAFAHNFFAIVLASDQG